MKKLLRWLVTTILGIILFVTLCLVVVTVFAIPVELTRFKAPLEDIAAKWLARPVQIEGSIIVATSLKPAFTLKGLRIQNPSNFEQNDFLLMDEVRLQLSVLPLFKRKIHIPEFKVHGLTVTLEENEQDKVNWVFGPQETNKSTDTTDETSTSPVEQAGSTTDSKKKQSAAMLANDSIVVEKLDLQKIKVAFYSKGEEQPSTFILSRCDGAMDVGKPMILDIEGKADDFDYSIDVSLASLEEFLRNNRTWAEINLEIAKTSFNLTGDLDLKTAARSLTLSASVSGENLSSLGDLLKIDLPPFASYQLTTQLHLKKNVAELQKLKIETGASSLTGSAHIEKVGEDIAATVDLHSPYVQIDDFIFEEWSWEASEEPGEEESLAQPTEDQKDVKSIDEKSDQGGKKKKLIDPQLLQQFDCTLSVVSDRVESGKDFLGSGELKVTVKDGRIDVDPLSLNLPGGSVDLEASLKPGNENSEGSLKVLIENFDIGILVRRKQPESVMGGNINLNIDLNSTANSIAELLASGDGYFDFSGNLTNLKSGIIDLWAVNLISAIVSSTKEKQSQINCAVGRWSVDNGLLTSDAFFIDTSKIRICAKGDVNLKEESLNIRVAPRAKRAEFFSLATPVKLQGTFSDLNVKLGGGGVLGTVVQMIVSPVSTPLKRMFNHKIPHDGGDVCGMELGPDNRDELVVPGCQ